MRLLEYRSKKILAHYGIPIPRGRTVDSPAAAAAAAADLGFPVIIKAQAPVGGRGKAGLIKRAADANETKIHAESLFHQTVDGFSIGKVLVEEALEIVAEYYLGITIDRARRRPVAMVSSLGGIDIEDVARDRPEKIAKVWPNPLLGLHPYQARDLCLKAGLPADTIGKAAAVLERLYQAMIETDALLAEINPLAATVASQLTAVDVKLEVDDNALFRQPNLAELASEELKDEHELEARRAGLAYVFLDGDIGVIGNGAGLVMATLDAIRLAGGRPANFLDVGGGASSEKIAAALKIIFNDKRLSVVLINIFGGITRCDEVARGILDVLAVTKLKVKLIVRLVGTEAAAGRAILKDAGITTVEEMDDAAELAVDKSRELGVDS